MNQQLGGVQPLRMAPQGWVVLTSTIKMGILSTALNSSIKHRRPRASTASRLAAKASLTSQCWLSSDVMLEWEKIIDFICQFIEFGCIHWTVVYEEKSYGKIPTLSKRKKWRGKLWTTHLIVIPEIIISWFDKPNTSGFKNTALFHLAIATELDVNNSFSLQQLCTAVKLGLWVTFSHRFRY